MDEIQRQVFGLLGLYLFTRPYIPQSIVLLFFLIRG